ncbi:MAG: hypothetical protein F6K16_08430 [Symploca sp. SIO2B6]|nr:hypothetical protein [Symploca sp. SIO2B6]
MLTSSSTRISNSQVIFWFSLSLAFAAIYSLLSLQEAFSAQYVVQDDARQHVFWMQRFLDPELFANDLIADYFQAVAPAGYTTVYKIATAFGINPFLFNKLLPIFLSLVTASYCFGVCLQLLPVPAAAFSSTLLLSQALGLTDAIVSGTPKAFIYPLFLAFIYYLLRGSLLPCLGAIAMQGLFYPQLVFISAGTLLLRMLVWRDSWLHLSQDKRHRLFCLAGLAVALLVMLPYALKTNEFGPVITAAEAKELPEFLPGGRSRFFYDDDPGKFWLKGRSGIRLASALTPVTNVLGFLLPLLLLFPAKFPLVKQVSNNTTILPQVLLASLGMFFAAHALLFRLHLPSRYAGHSLRIILTLTSGIVLVVLIDAMWHWAKQHSRLLFPIPGLLALTTTVFLIGVLLSYPFLVDKFPLTAYKVGTTPSLYQFFQQQPKTSLIASLAHEVNELPTFAQRPILIGGEYAIPYHKGYYDQFRQRTLDLIEAQYSSDSNLVRKFIQKYGVDFWLVNQAAFNPDYLKKDRWLRQYQPAAKQARKNLKRGNKPILQQSIEVCSVFETQGLVVLEADCILQALPTKTSANHSNL